MRTTDSDILLIRRLLQTPRNLADLANITGVSPVRLRKAVGELNADGQLMRVGDGFKLKERFSC